ncbi:TLD-domain-containing protein [Spinellus fusiger]|nr:TLD-domain-containing protein [Spinellus fusiger]
MTPVLTLHYDPQTTPCLDVSLAERLQPWLPSRVAIASQWCLLYSLEQHGCSLSTLYHCIKDKGPCFLVLRNTEEEVLGAYLSEPFRIDSRYYGSGECFLWHTGNTNQLHVFPWTMANNYMIYSDASILAVGGGNGHFGLSLDCNLINGSSHVCPTFASPCLTQNTTFKCTHVELWGVQF